MEVRALQGSGVGAVFNTVAQAALIPNFEPDVWSVGPMSRLGRSTTTGAAACDDCASSCIDDTCCVCVVCVCVRARVSTNGRGEGAGEMNVGERQMERDRDGRLARVILGVVPNFA